MTLNCCLPQTVKAFEMTFEGVDYFVIEKKDLSVLYEAAAETPAAGTPVKTVKVKRAVAARPIHAEAPVEMTRRPAPIQDAICQQLMRKPMTSLELGEVLGVEKLPSIYGALATMRKQGNIATAPDENGTRKHSLVIPRKVG